MDTKKLRQKILDLAIRGKLVPQDPNDEPASVLLERIREEKKQMVKEGKLKAKDIKNDTIIFKGEDNLHYEKFQDGTLKCIEDEIPFAIPESWKWCRVRDVLSFKGGYAYKSNKYVAESCNYIIRIGNVKNNNVNPYVAQTCISDEYASETEDYKLHANDIVFTMTGTKGRRDYFFSALVSEKLINGLNLYLNQRVGCLRCIVGDTLNTSYILECLQASFTLNAIFATETGNVNQGNIGSAATLNLLLPIPPISEQEKISQKVCAVLNKIDVYEKETFSLENLIALIKQSILDKAIRGKLVSQSVDDEPASVLLERIRAEKEELIKQGNLRRDKKESIIYKGDDNSYYQTGSSEPIEVPYEIPETWTWSNLKELCNYGVCDNIPPEAIDSDAWILDLEDIEKDTGRIVYRATNAERKTTSTKHSFHKDMILYSKLRPYLNKVVLADADGYCTSEIIPLSFSEIILPRYAQLFLMSPFFVGYANHCSYGMKMPRLGTHDGEMALFAIPPYQEQARIVDMVDKLHANIDKIQESLTM